MRISKGEGRPPLHCPTLEELAFLIDQLKGRETLTDETRGEIINALEWLHLDIFGNECEAQWGKGGRPPADETTLKASIVAALKDKHRVPIKAGLWAVEPADNPGAEKRRQAIARKCSDIRSGKADGRSVADEQVQSALRKIKNRK
jgi:hypothetical protein